MGHALKCLMKVSEMTGSGPVLSENVHNVTVIGCKCLPF